MTAALNALGMFLDLAIVLLAFTLIIVVHELGHFLAARWAGIRVLCFAVGFGSPLVSYRKGLGWRRGSSVPEYNALARHIDTTVDRGWLHVAGRVNRPVSPTEYRLNSLPFGGYVKMLGQDDADPGAVSNEPDGYQRAQPWKRMVVISAGVVFNLVSAALLFVVVFMAGLETEPPVIGAVDPTAPAASAVAAEAGELNITTPGLQPGDRVLSIDGDPVQSFKDIMLASAMAHRGDDIGVSVRREGVPRPLTFRVVPREDRVSHLLQFGVAPGVSNRVYTSRNPAEVADVRAALEHAGLAGVEPGMRLARVNGADVKPSGGGGAAAISNAARESQGRPVTLDFVTDPPRPGDPAGPPFTVTLQPTPKLDQLALQLGADSAAFLSHVAGLATAMQVEVVSTDGAKASGLLPGDVFAQIGAVEWPSQPAGVAEIRRYRGSAVHVAVARRTTPDAPWSIVDLKLVPVSKEGQIGFSMAPPERSPLFLGDWSELPLAKSPDASPSPPSPPTAAPSPAGPADATRPATLEKLKLFPGTLLTKVGDTPVRTLADVRVALAALGAAADPRAASITVHLTVVDPIDAIGSPNPPARTVAWTIDRSPASPERTALLPVTWQADSATGIFDVERFELRAAGPAQALGMGLRETRQVMLSTYVTILRLFQGSVKVEHLKGPVGIAHMGTMLIDRGPVWLLFFCALVSVNLAVINFLPIPVFDGGHIVFLAYEQLTGRPASVGVQNAAALVGLAIIACLFLVVTFNDITNLVTGR
jgi:regulator of sigma E protease